MLKIKNIISELKNITWVKMRSISFYTFLVVLGAALLTTYIYGIDRLCSMLTEFIVGKF